MPSADESPLRTFNADLLPNGLFGDVKIFLFNDRVIIDYGSEKRTYYIRDLSNVKLVEGFGINWIVAKYHGVETTLVSFTNRYKEDMEKLIGILTTLMNVPNVDANSNNNLINNDNNIEKSKFKTVSWLLSIIKPYRFRIAFGVALTLTVTGIALVPPYLLKLIINDVLLVKGSRDVTLFNAIIMALAGVYASSVILSMGQNYVLNYLGQRLSNEIRVRIYEFIFDQSLRFIDRFQSGRILSRITTDVGNMQWFLIWGIPTVIANVAMLVGAGVIMFGMDPKLGFYALLPIPVIIVGTLMYRRISRYIYHRAWRRSADIMSLLTDTIPAWEVVKAYANDKYEEDKLRNLMDEYFNAQISIVKTNLSWFPILGFVISLTTLIIWFIGGYQVMSGVMPLGTLVAFISYAGMFYQPVQNLMNVIPFMQQSFTSAERVLEIMNNKPDIVQDSNPIRHIIKGYVKFENVTFGYDPLNPVVKNIDFEVKPGEVVAIVGRSGSGKSTLMKLLLRFYDPNRGRILIDGIDLRKLDLDFYRSQIGYVSADPVIFYGTVADNIRYGKLNAKSEEIIAAALASGAHDFIMALPLAYDTHIGERGSRVSTGQRQLIALARALIREPRLLILDEATLSIDSISEAHVWDSIRNAARGVTTIIITHRLTSLQWVDRIIVLERGRIIEVGNHEELMEKRGRYYEMYMNQVKMGTGEVVIGDAQEISK